MRFTCFILFLSLIAIHRPATAQTYAPYGVQTNVPVDTVLNDWGWTIVWQGGHGDMALLSNVFAGVAADDPETWVMYAARPAGSEVFTLLAAAPAVDALTVTLPNVTVSSNGRSGITTVIPWGSREAVTRFIRTPRTLWAPCLWLEITRNCV